MPYNTNMDTITVGDVTYDVERASRYGGGASDTLTLSLDGEPVFEGLEGSLGHEEHDAEFFNPRDWTNVGTMDVNYRGYKLGDNEPDEDQYTVTCDRCDGYGERYFEITTNDEDALFPVREVGVQCAKCHGAGEPHIDPARWYRLNKGARVVIGLFVYEHSGITMSAGPTIGGETEHNDIRSSGRFIGDGAGWDTSFVGFIYDTPEGIKDCLGDNATDDEIEAALRSEVSVYASYLEGDVTWWSVQDDETDYMEGCGGYVASSDECEAECFASLETAIIKRLGENDERDHWNSRDVPTV